MVGLCLPITAGGTLNIISSSAQQDAKAAGLLIREEMNQLMHEWEVECRRDLPAARAQGRLELRDSMPALLNRLVETLISSHPETELVANFDMAIEHGADRASQPEYSLDQVMYEFQVLRELLISALEQHRPIEIPTRKIVRDFIDCVIRGSAIEYTKLQKARDDAAINAKITHSDEQHQLREQLGSAVAIAKVGFFEWEISTKNFSVSDQFRQDWQTEKDTSLDATWERIHPEDRDRIMALVLNCISECIPYKAEYRLLFPDGEMRWIEAQGEVTYDAKDRPLRFFGTSIDITARKNATAELEKSVMDFRAERELRERFVSALTHDLRTPMSAAKMSAQLIERKSDDPATVQMLAHRIVENMDRADRMIRDLLDANRIKAGEGLPISPTACQLDELLDTVAKDLVLVHGPRFDWSNRVGPAEVYWDGTGIQRILENLAGNAIKYGRQNGPITISVRKVDEQIEISVHNQGLPIAPVDQETLFNPYRRTQGAVAGGQRGWGIGLTLVKGIAEAHGGKTCVESNAKQGTTFSVTLPVQARNC